MVIFTYTKTNPSTWFGGTWEQLSGGYLYLCASSTEKTSYTGLGTQSGGSGNTGSTAITKNQLPKIDADSNVNVVCHQAYSTSGDVYYAYGGKSGSLTGGDYMPFGHIKIKFGNGEGHTHTVSAHSHDIATVGFFAWRRTA